MGAHILVIEDNEASLDLMTYLLNAFGHTTIAARDGGHGLVRARTGGVDLVVCDIQLPRVDGFEIARLLKSEPGIAGVPLIAVTALDMAGDHEKVLAAGFDGCISKPIAPDRFVGQIEAFLPANLRSPRALPDETSDTGRLDGPPPASPAHILVVDDTQANVDLLRAVLEPTGYRVSTAHSLATALECANTDRPDLIISDLQMPAGSGLDLLAAVNRDRRFEPTPFVLITATQVSEQDRAVGIARGARKFLLRPISAAQLVAEIEECLKRT